MIVLTEPYDLSVYFTFLLSYLIINVMWIVELNKYIFVCLFFNTGDISLVDVRTAFSMIGKFGIAAAFIVVYLIGPEIFPTTLRCR